jgi:hypothetical protein
MTEPTPGPIFSPTVLVKATATDADGIAQVEFFMQDVQSQTPPSSLGVDTTFPYEVTWTLPFACGQSVDLFAVATDNCGSTATSSHVNVNVQSGACFAFPSARRLVLGTDLAVPGATAQVVVNGAQALLQKEGRTEAITAGVKGENRVEAVLAEAQGRPGTWRFEARGAEVGSLRVLAGEVQSIAGDAVVFRLRGVVGERVAFTFRRPE